jgi:hypothetical protein
MKKLLRSALAMSIPALGLSGCYMVPVVEKDGTLQYYAYPVPPVGTPIAAPQAATPVPPGPISAAPPVPAGPPMPVVLTARLYPENSIATQIGMLSGTVTNMMTGKGRFQLDYRGEVLVGEATRVAGEEKKGVANAWGHAGSYMSCEYELTSPRLGVGTCMFSNGAKYKVHLGS